MKKSSTIFLQIVLVLIGLCTLALLLLEPHFEGRNAQATFFVIYFQDPFLAYVYTASSAFFVALYQAFKLLTLIGQNKVFSLKSVYALRTIKYCALAIIAFTAAPIVSVFIIRPQDDAAGAIAMGLLIIFVSSVIATAAAVFARLLQTAVDLKSENDLTV